MTGTATRNTEPHQKTSSRTPPTSGPTAPPSMKLVIHTVMAKLRCSASRNMALISESVEGPRTEPARPRSARATMRVSAVGA
ncbi:hypothetical protein GCM10010329_82500 [Streptomyces spiroverticillatus]|uniref:Uncharacterized protein n=1 Tax=Streptomyces finlayi TaxID=67296 RepID=A0A918X8L2_9ACTN|nr:hypothetical protein GCM10010329_82500 [Streptomyces spiroverticillatus]GHD18442.1 hypothetical protein GCM10010334_81300 [Streptomyces finlayi]